MAKFSEKKFNLDGSDCYSYHWHHLDAKGVTRSKRNFCGGTVMVWGAFCYQGKLPICFISTHMNSNTYMDLLGNVLISYIEHKSHNDFIFQQDNDSIHVCKHSKEWFSRMDIPLLEWPACSPDCNPIENLWAILARNVYSSGRQFDISEV